jgi:hypothetical protein
MTTEVKIKIKKTMQPIYKALAAGLANEEISQGLFEQVIPHLQPKKSPKSEGSTQSGLRNAILAEDGQPLAILDYYFKRWMPVVGEAAVEFGSKKNTATGLNTMCKEGVSHWTKQQKEAKEALAQILVDVESGELEPTDISSRREEIEENRKRIEHTDLGFATIEEVRKYLEAEGFTPADAQPQGPF